MSRQKWACDNLKTGDTIYIGDKLYTLEVANTFFSRFMGLMGRKSLAPNHAMLITECSSIHTFFMRFPMTAIFLSGDLCVTKIVPNMKPWDMAFAPVTKTRTRCVLEIAAGDEPEIFEGDTITGVLREQKLDLPKDFSSVPANVSIPSQDSYQVDTN